MAAGVRARRSARPSGGDAIAHRWHQGERPLTSIRHRRAESARTHAPGSNNLSKPNPDVDRIVEELMGRDLTKAERMACLRELAKSGDDVPDDLMDEALRKLMERITE